MHQQNLCWGEFHVFNDIQLSVLYLRIDNTALGNTGRLSIYKNELD